MCREHAFSDVADDLHRIIWQTDDRKVTVALLVPASPGGSFATLGSSKSCHMHVIFETYSAPIPINPVKGSR